MEVSNTGFSYDWLVPIGASTKRDSNGSNAGYFGEGFKIASLCAVRDYGWDIRLSSRDWHLQVVADTVTVDGCNLKTLAYDISQQKNYSDATMLTISPFNNQPMLDAVMLSFYYPGNPLLGKKIWSNSTAAVYHRSSTPTPRGYPKTSKAHGPGIIFAGFQALGSIPHPLVFCLHNYRHDDRERNFFFLMDVISIIKTIVSKMPPTAAKALLENLQRHWYAYPQKKYDFESWHPIISTLVRNISECPKTVSRWRAEYPNLLVAEHIRRSDLVPYNQRRQALAWWKAEGRKYRLVQKEFASIYLSLLSEIFFLI
jgi:hypothetical protein